MVVSSRDHLLATSGSSEYASITHSTPPSDSAMTRESSSRFGTCECLTLECDVALNLYRILFLLTLLLTFLSQATSFVRGLLLGTATLNPNCKTQCLFEPDGTLYDILITKDTASCRSRDKIKRTK